MIILLDALLNLFQIFDFHAEERLPRSMLHQHFFRRFAALGFELLHGGGQSSFTSFRAGTSYLNLIAQPAEQRWSWWGRVIFYVADVDALYDLALAAGYQPATVPRDAEWGERFFHLDDPTATT